MYKFGWDYLFYFGVIEVGEGEDGCMKFFIGIGVFLFDGFGDIICVFFIEVFEFEIESCTRLVNFGMKVCVENIGVE